MLVIPIFVPHAGCPHDCCFCNQKIISGQTALPDDKEIAGIIERFRPAAERYDEVQLAFYGGSFTAIDETLQLMFLKTVQPYLRKNGGFIDTLRLSTRPDCIDADVIERLQKYNVSVVELGAQSMDDNVLNASGRGHLSNDTETASELLLKNGFILGIQTMTGLPSATPESDIETAVKICSIMPDFVRIYPTVVVNGTALHRSFLNGKYIPPTVEEAVELCSILYKIYSSAGIKIVRMGLQSSDNISNDGEIAAGPYHCAFGQLVRSHILLKKMIEKLNCCDGNICKSKASVINARELFRGYKLDVFVKENEISDYIGQKRSNAESLKKYFGFRGVRFWPLERLADKKRLFESKSFFKDVFVDRQNLTVSILCDE